MGQFEFQGYDFANAKEMEQAMKEAESIAYIRSKSDFDDTKKLKKVYEMLLEKHAYTTVIGLSFLKEIQQRLVTSGEEMIVSIPVLPLLKAATSDNQQSKEFAEMIEKRKQDKKEIYEVKLKKSRIINISLVLIIIIMFIIVLTSDQSPFVNAESVIQDKYVAWEESLEERERVIEQKEAELQIKP